MGILAIQYRLVEDAPILIAFNREERYGRQFTVPRIQSGRPRVVCSVDRKSGGTWAGVNQRGLFVAAINSPKRISSYDLLSRGTLCKTLLSCESAEEAIERALKELATDRYAGVTYLCVDQTSGGVVYGKDEVSSEPLKPGLHILSESKLDDRDDERQEHVRRLLTLHRLDSAVAFLAATSDAFSRAPDGSGRRGAVLCESNYGTVCSTLVALSERTSRSIMQFANGCPIDAQYEDYSALLRQVLSTDRGTQKKKPRKRGTDLPLDVDDSLES